MSTRIVVDLFSLQGAVEGHRLFKSGFGSDLVSIYSHGVDWHGSLSGDFFDLYIFPGYW